MAKKEGAKKEKKATKKVAPKPPKVYKAIQKFNYDHRNYEVGEVIPDFPKEVIKELLEAKAIE